MNETKFFLSSKTFQGILVMILAALLPRFGLEFGDTELAGLASDIALGIGALWAAVGRVTAKKSVSLGKGNAVAACLLVLLVPLMGCAIKKVADAPAHEQARFYADQLGKAYLDLSEGYIDAYPDMTTDEQAWCGKNLKPVLERFKMLADGTISAAKAWSLAVDDRAGLDAKSEEAQAALARSDQARKRYDNWLRRRPVPTPRPRNCIIPSSPRSKS